MVCKCDLNYYMFLRFYFFIYSLVLVSIEKKQSFITFPNTSNFIKNTPLRVVFLTLFFLLVR